MQVFHKGVSVVIRLIGDDAYKWKNWAVNQYRKLAETGGLHFRKHYQQNDVRLDVVREGDRAYLTVFAGGQGMGYEFLASNLIFTELWAVKNAYLDPYAAWNDPMFDWSAHTYDIAVSGRGVYFKSGKNQKIIPKFDMVASPQPKSLTRLPWEQRYDFPTIGDPGNPGGSTVRAGTTIQYYFPRSDSPVFTSELAWNNQKLPQYIHWVYPPSEGVYGDEFIISTCGLYGGFRSNDAGKNSDNFIASHRQILHDIGCNDIAGGEVGTNVLVEDTGPDVNAILFTKSSVATGGPKYQQLSILDLNPPEVTLDDPTARWWRRHAIQVVTSEDYGTRRFVVATDSKSRFYVYPLKDYGTGPTLASGLVQYADPPYPSWVWHTEGVANGHWVWEFNKGATKAVAVAYNAVFPTTPLKIVSRFAQGTSGPLGSTYDDIRCDTPGIVEVDINISLTGSDETDFTFGLSLGRELFPSAANNSCYLSASYAFGHKNLSAEGFNEDDLVTLEFDLYAQDFTKILAIGGVSNPATVVRFDLADYYSSIADTVKLLLNEVTEPGGFWTVTQGEFLAKGWTSYSGLLFARYGFSAALRKQDAADTYLASGYIYNSPNGVTKDEINPTLVDYALKFVSHNSSGAVTAEKVISWQTGQWLRYNELHSPATLQNLYGIANSSAGCVDLCAGYEDHSSDYTGSFITPYPGELVASGCGYSYLYACDLRSLSWAKVFSEPARREYTWTYRGTSDAPDFVKTRVAYPSVKFGYDVYGFNKKIKSDFSDTTFSMPSINTNSRPKIPWQFNWYARDIAINYFNPHYATFSVHPKGAVSLCTSTNACYDYFLPSTRRWYNFNTPRAWTIDFLYAKWGYEIDIIHTPEGKNYTHRQIYNAAFNDIRDYTFYYDLENGHSTAGRFATWGVWYL